MYPIPDKAALDAIRQKLGSVRELLLANAVMFGEIPAPTFAEAARAQFMLDRFNEAGCQGVSTDDAGNAVAILPGRVGRGNILVSAHLDTVFPQGVDHTVHVRTRHLSGAGIMDNSLGVAAVASLPLLLEAAGIELEDNLILLGTTRSHGAGNIEGMRFFLENNPLPVRAALLCEGGTLGRLSYASLDMLRGKIEITLPAEYSTDGDFDEGAEAKEQGGAKPDGLAKARSTTEGSRHDHGAISVLNRVLSGILALEVPQQPLTQVILGAVEAGGSYNLEARSAVLRFEVRSEGEGVVGVIAKSIEAIIAAVAADTHWCIGLRVVAQRHRYCQPEGSAYVDLGRRVLEQLGIAARPAPSTGEIEALLARDIPALTIGLTYGSNRHERDETIEIDPIFTGLTQMLALLCAVDGGLSDAD